MRSLFDDDRAKQAPLRFVCKRCKTPERCEKEGYMTTCIARDKSYTVALCGEQFGAKGPSFTTGWYLPKEYQNGYCLICFEIATRNKREFQPSLFGD